MFGFDLNNSWWGVLLAVGALLLCVVMGASGCSDVKCLENERVMVRCEFGFCYVELPADACVKRN